MVCWVAYGSCDTPSTLWRAAEPLVPLSTRAPFTNVPEGNVPEGNVPLGSVPDGTYQLRIEPHFDATPVKGVAHIDVRRGAFMTAPMLLALFALLFYPMAGTFRAAGFERQRWMESDHG